MTRFVDIHTIGRIINRTGVEPFLKGLADTMREDFRNWQDFEKCARVASHSEIGVIELMPISNNESYGFKYVNGHPANTAKGMSTVMAFGALADVETGYPRLISELTLTTAFRTASASAIAAEALARPDSSVLGMIGSGAQAEFQALAFHALLGIEHVRIFDIDPAAMRKFESHMAAYPEIEVTLVDSAAEAAKGADIVTTCTADKALATILTEDMVAPGTHINGVGGDCPGKTELSAGLLRRAKIFVEYEPQTRIEGDIQQLEPEHPVTELWEVLTGRDPGRENASDITVFDSVGFALEDFSALRYVDRLAAEYDEGEIIEIVPSLENPKDLFGMVNVAEEEALRLATL